MKTQELKYDSIVAIILSFIGGILDIYCLINFDLYATLHTGNMIKLATYFIDKDSFMFLTTTLILLSFGIGIYLANVIENRNKKENTRELFIVSIVILVMAMLIPNDAPQGVLSVAKMIAAVLFGLEGAFIIHSFVSFDEFKFSATTMTANINRLVTNIYNKSHDKEKKKSYGISTYIFIFIAFLLGVALGYLYLTHIVFLNNKFLDLYKYNLLIVVPIILMFICMHISKKRQFNS